MGPAVVLLSAVVASHTGFITLNIDLIPMGVGGNDSWSDVAAPLEQYQIKAKDYHYSFYIVPFNAKSKTAGDKAKEIKF